MVMALPWVSVGSGGCLEGCMCACVCPFSAPGEVRGVYLLGWGWPHLAVQSQPGQLHPSGREECMRDKGHWTEERCSRRKNGGGGWRWASSAQLSKGKGPDVGWELQEGGSLGGRAGAVKDPEPQRADPVKGGPLISAIHPHPTPTHPGSPAALPQPREGPSAPPT